MTYTQEKNQCAKVSWNEEGQPVSDIFGDVYFSKAGGLDETRYVFIEGNQLHQRLAVQRDDTAFTIAETGFGTGLNFLSTWQFWQSKMSRVPLHFISVEKYPLSRANLKRALALWPELADYSAELLAAYPPQPSTGLHRLTFNNGSITLSLYFGEAYEGFEQLAALKRGNSGEKYGLGPHQSSVDAWYLDGFAPAKNPEMWSPRLVSAIAELSATRTSFATFTAASDVRRLLSDCGFSCRKIKGFGRKREMLVGVFEPSQAQHIATPAPNANTQGRNDPHKPRARTPLYWHLMNRQAANTKPRSCLVIGGGIAGCQTARALAERNIKVTLLEKNAALAEGASGNPQAILYAKLSPFNDPLSTFNLNSLIFANSFYRSRQLFERCGDASGVLFLANSEKQQRLYSQLAEQFLGEDFAVWLQAADCKNISGVASDVDALFIPHSGWLNPRALCQELIAHPNIELKHYSDIADLQRTDESWRAVDEGNKTLATADAAVLCCAHEAKKFSHSQHLPLKKIRGQITQLAGTPALNKLKTVICGASYIAPSPTAQADEYTIGASYNLNEASEDLRAEDQRENIERTRILSPDFAMLTGCDKGGKEEPLRGRVGFRCTTPDYFPIVGPLHKHGEMLATFGPLRKKAKAGIAAPGNYHPHLYCHLGLGSRGLCYSPLCADILASLISGDFLPINQELYRFLHPARFLIRDLMRNKI